MKLSKSKTELYFCLRLTENEHFLVKSSILEQCSELKLKLKYYRTLKEGHVPLYREIKVVGDNINEFVLFLKKEQYLQFTVPNPHRSH